MQKINVAIFASGNGSNCENIIRYFRDSEHVSVTLVVSNRADAFVLERVKPFGIATEVVPKSALNEQATMMDIVQRHHVDFIVLAGFLPLIPNFLIEAYPLRIVNIHPSLLPKYGGKGMWGHHVHEAVKAAGDTETGMTIHYVTPVCDGGDIIAQFSVPLSPDDSVDDIMAKEHQLEMKHYPEVLEQLFENLS